MPESGYASRKVQWVAFCADSLAVVPLPPDLVCPDRNSGVLPAEDSLVDFPEAEGLPLESLCSNTLGQGCFGPLERQAMLDLLAQEASLPVRDVQLEALRDLYSLVCHLWTWNVIMIL